MQSDFAVLSDAREFAIFKALNADVFFVDSDENLSEDFKKLASKYKLLFICESLAEKLKDYIKNYESKTYPIIISLPDAKKNGGFAIKNLVKKAKTSLGLDIFKENL